MRVNDNSLNIASSQNHVLLAIKKKYYASSANSDWVQGQLHI